MKTIHLPVIGTILMIAGIIISPFMLPDDLITEPIYIAFFTGAFGSDGLIAFAIWTAIGYILFALGFILVGHSIINLEQITGKTKKIETIIKKHPQTMFLVFIGMTLLVFLGGMANLGIISFIGIIILIVAFAYMLETKTIYNYTFIGLLLAGFFILTFAEIPAMQTINISLQNLLETII